MRPLAIFALIFADEIESGASSGIISFGVEGKRSPHRISPEEPRETRTLPCTGSSISRNQPGSKIRIIHYSLNCADARPIVGLLQSRVGEFKGYCPVEISAVVI